MPPHSDPPPPPTAARLIIAACALVCVGVVAVAGLTAPLVLMILFVGWALSPFVGMLALVSLRPEGTPRRRAIRAALTLSVVSVVVYGLVLVSPPPTARAVPYLLWPALSWLMVVGAGLWTTRPKR